MNRFVVVAAASAVIVAACGAAETVAGTTTTTPEVTAAEITTTTTAVPASATSSTGVAPEAETAAPTGAAATFSMEHLNLGAGSQFVPVDDSNYVPAASATWLDPRDVVLGVVRGDVAVAFPVKQMAYHHIANVEIAGEPYLVTY